MKTTGLASKGRRLLLAILVGLPFFLNACSAHLKSIQPEAELKGTSPPAPEITPYTEVLFKLGRMAEIYNAPSVNIQSEDIVDDTGTSSPLSTGGEIQRDITEIMKTTLNSIGGKVRFVDYDPAYVNNMMLTGYSKFENKIIPDVVVTGGITGFDRALETKGNLKDFSVEGEFPNVQAGSKSKTFPPSRLVGFSYSRDERYSIAKISLDFTMKEFQTLAGIPYMSVTNSMIVGKSIGEREISVTILGPTFGLKGTTKRVQGRHEAVRLLVQVSMIQLVGRYLAIPYWRLLGPDAKPDKFVIMAIDGAYSTMDEFTRLVKVQEWLYLHGYKVTISGEMDEDTIKALKSFDPEFNEDSPEITKELFRKLYLSIPITDEAYMRRVLLNQLLS